MMETKRAYSDTDTALTVWLRDDAGKIDFTAQALSVALYAYGVPMAYDTLVATSAAAGKVNWTVPADTVPGLYRYAVLADGENVGGGILEVI